MYGLLGIVLLWQAARLLDRLWWRPRRLERALRAQGLRGTSYRFLTGDINDNGAYAAVLPRHRPPRRAVPLQHRPGARKGVLLLVRPDPQGDHHRP